MYCPRCASNQSDEVKFCKNCGANLFAVRQVVDSKETRKAFDWSDTWVAEMFLSSEENKRRKLEMERRRGITPEVKRFNEIKAGVITSCVGVSLMILLFVLMGGIVLSGKVDPDTAEILSRIWIAGVLPLFVGIALIINGVFVSKKLAEISKEYEQSNLPEGETNRQLGPADTSEFVQPGFSVTEQTTRHLGSEQKR